MRSPSRRVKCFAPRINLRINHGSVTVTRNLRGYVSHFRRWALPVCSDLFPPAPGTIFSRINHGHAYVVGGLITRFGATSPLQITPPNSSTKALMLNREYVKPPDLFLLPSLFTFYLGLFSYLSFRHLYAKHIEMSIRGLTS
ncbi:hypothetical protein AVEN_230995-1 [Araneus ventricosus]|uniref:Uncharacterized protein n=1 Tax=Araneus ventricosus TaxID=182803 RepID=A0A4Y2A3Z6_ARAVE|nr:hypothetical protein AVEN_230995-1 [Araneus ventricosus]